MQIVVIIAIMETLCALSNLILKWQADCGFYGNDVHIRDFKDINRCSVNWTGCDRCVKLMVMRQMSSSGGMLAVHHLRS